MIETDKLVAVERIIAPQTKSAQEEALERALRPKRLADYTGQVKIREQLEIFIQAAKNRSESLDHVLPRPNHIQQYFLMLPLANQYHRPN